MKIPNMTECNYVVKMLDPIYFSQFYTAQSMREWGGRGYILQVCVMFLKTFHMAETEVRFAQTQNFPFTTYSDRLWVHSVSCKMITNCYLLEVKAARA